MKVLMVGVDSTSLGGMLTVVENYINNNEFCKKTCLKYIPVTTHGNKIKKIFFSGKALCKTVRTIKKDKIDIVHVHMSDGGSAFREGLILLIAKKGGCKTVSHMHSADYENWYNRQNQFNKKIVSELLRNADVIFALGQQWKDIYERVTNYKSKVEVLYNAVNVPATNNYDIESKNVLFLAHMIKRKGIDDFLDAILIIKNKIPKDTKFVLYGADRENNIEERIQSRKLNDTVVYRGWLNGEDKIECLKDTMLNVLPSYHEGLPMTILETMAYGIPNISTNIAAIPEAVSDGKNGILIEPGDVENLAGNMQLLINDESVRRRISDAAYNTARKKFSLDTHINRVLCVYRDLLDAK